MFSGMERNSRTVFNCSTLFCSLLIHAIVLYDNAQISSQRRVTSEML